MIYCDNCNRVRARINTEVCCNVLVSDGLTFRDLMNEVRTAATEVAASGVYRQAGSVIWEAGQWINAHLEEFRGMVDEAKRRAA